jgi:MSHA pilin protein MshC
MLPHRASGVTLVELLVVVGILGIAAAFAVPRFFDDRTFLQRNYYEELVAGLKYAQRLAVASGCPVRVVIDAAGYTARQHVCAADDSLWPAAQERADGLLLKGAAPMGVSVSPGVTLTFDPLGSTDLTADQSINVGPFALTVLSETGRLIQAHELY